MARTAKRVVRRDWTRQDERELKRHSKTRTPLKAISKALKRTPGALRQKASASRYSDWTPTAWKITAPATTKHSLG
jgi:hypothetical protein